ncbi:lamin tail domain-containing protein [Amycolatopsis sp. NPDC051045]|uniref:lamin tail domain-containing protein n=1 Tax=Amycolatopsis sp. NPDC051045 TaxID=3156922 RepID=UPI003417BF6F
MPEPGVKIRKVVVVETSGPEDKGEYVLLHNNGPADADLSGWRLGDAELHPVLPFVYEFPSGRILLAGADLRIHSTSGVDDAKNLFWGHHDSLVWTNTQDRVVLVDKAEQLVDTMEWFNRPPHGRVVRTDEIREDIASRAAAQGFGAPLGAVQWGVREDDTEFFWQEFSAGGAIFHSGFPTDDAPEKHVNHVRAEIYKKYKNSSGGETAKSVKQFGLPLTSTASASVGEDPAMSVPNAPGPPSREPFFNDFETSSIYWSEKTGAQIVRGTIRDKWKELGGSDGPFGLPVSDELPDDAVGTDLRFSDFEKGSIWSTRNQVRAITEIRIDFVGFRCFGEEEIDQDEVYFAFEAKPLNRPRAKDPEEGVWVGTLPLEGEPYGGVDNGGSYDAAGGQSGAAITVFQGRPAPIEVNIRAWEHDSGGPNAFRDVIKSAVSAAAAVGAALVPAGAAVFLNPDVQETVTNAINALAGTDDEFIGRGQWRINSRQEMLNFLDGPLIGEPGDHLRRHKDFDIIAPDGDAFYKPAFKIVPVAL